MKDATSKNRKKKQKSDKQQKIDHSNIQVTLGKISEKFEFNVYP